MHSSQPTAIYRKDYKAPEFDINSVHLDFTVVSEEEVMVVNTMVVQRLEKNSSSPLLLDGENMELLGLNLDGHAVSKEAYKMDAEGLTLLNLPNSCKLVITTKINPKANTLLSGLYFADGLFCTQCESSGFRRITYFMDHPDVLSHFTVRIQADRKKYPVLLSNGNCIAQDDISVTWEDPFKKPAYLFALVIGDLARIEDHFITQSGRKIALEIYVDHGNEDKCDHAMESLKNAMRWDEEKFGLEYDLDIYMVVAVRSFNMGAMENKGLNIFNAKYVLARPDNATDADFFGIERVIGHEYFHNWTGNRVTCRDWFQLSLKEGLTVYRDQEFSRDMQKSSVCRIQDVKTLRSHQFAEDAGPMSHPVRPESYIEINNFYTATVYNKGAEVIRMQQMLLGRDGFRKGMDLYFKRHDGQAVTIDDFVKAMEDANSRDLTQFKRWYCQSGTPEINAHTQYDAQQQQFTLTLSQSCPPTPGQPTKEPFHIPVTIALFDEKGHAISIPESVLELKEPQQSWTWKNMASKPIVSLLRDFSAPVKCHINYTDAELTVLIQSETNDFARWETMQKLVYKYLLGDSTQGIIPTDCPDSLVAIFRSILNHSEINLLLKAEMLTLPNFIECSQSVKQINVDAIETARDGFYRTIGHALSEDFAHIYQSLQAKNSAAMTAEAFGERKLKNVALTYLTHAKHPQAKAWAQQQQAQAKNMTDELAALASLMHFDESTRDVAANDFYQKWQDDDLVLDKWFSVQAMSPLPSTLEKVRALLEHPKFDKKNPNKIKALLGAFWTTNPRCFHAIDGSGYQFLVPLILAFDRDNAFTSTSLVRSMISWKHFDEKRQDLMQHALQEILKDKAISRDLYEIVSKSLV